MRHTLGLLLLCCWGTLCRASEPAASGKAAADLAIGSKFQALDTLQPQVAPADDRQQKCLDGLCWKPTPFHVVLEEAIGDTDWLVRFPSPVTSAHPQNDAVALEWFVARDESGAVASRPAVVVVHESGRGMTVGKLFARGFRKAGYHAFLLHLPGYGARSWGATPAADELMILLRQGIADVRRARDAVACLPGVDRDSISLQGTSLGGIVSATVAGVDQQYTAIFLLLAGGDLPSLIRDGQRDAAKLRQQLREAQVTEDGLRELVETIDPLHLASRMNRERVWLYSGRYDTVVPMYNAEILAKTASLPREHHVVMPVDHYTGIFYFPVVMKHMDQQIRSLKLQP